MTGPWGWRLSSVTFLGGQLLDPWRLQLGSLWLPAASWRAGQLWLGWRLPGDLPAALRVVVADQSPWE